MTVEVLSSQIGSPYFSTAMNIYDGDTIDKVLARTRRMLGVTGNYKVKY